jgi:phosphoribosylamine--glycine ligase
MAKYGIPTAAAGTFDAAAAAKQFCATLGGKCVVKADGLALGKGVLICQNQGEAEKAVDEIMVNRAFGAAGSRVVIQEFLEGMGLRCTRCATAQTAKTFSTCRITNARSDGDRG